MIISIQSARYVDNYRLFLVFNTGECGEVDLQDIIFNYAPARSLRDIYYFKQFKLDEWATVTWDCGFDVSPETLYQRATGKQLDWLISSAEADFFGMHKQLGIETVEEELRLIRKGRWRN